jgi:phosphatidylglycerol---prolipoprotein diacylglyceryl transferase
MIEIGISPLAIGNLSWYVLFYSMGGAVVMSFIWLLVKKRILPSHRFTLLIAVATVLFSILFARLFYVIDGWQYFSQFPEKIFKLDGLYMNGALFGAACAIWIGSRLARVSFGMIMDAVTPGIIAGQMCGRIGCLLNGCCYGIKTDLLWGITYTNNAGFINNGTAYHPWQAYEILILLVILGTVIGLKPKHATPGLIFVLFMGLYSIWRLAGGFLRVPGDLFWGLQQAQVISLAVLVFSTAFLCQSAVRQKSFS